MAEEEAAGSRFKRPEGSVNNGIYGLAFVGAAIYYVQHATGLLDGALGIVKALFWPAVVMYKVLELLKL